MSINSKRKIHTFGAFKLRCWLNVPIAWRFWSWHWVDICHLVRARAQWMKIHFDTNPPQSKCRSHAAAHRFGVINVLVKLRYSDAFATLTKITITTLSTIAIAIKWNNPSNSHQTVSSVGVCVRVWFRHRLVWMSSIVANFGRHPVPASSTDCSATLFGIIRRRTAHMLNAKLSLRCVYINTLKISLPIIKIIRAYTRAASCPGTRTRAACERSLEWRFIWIVAFILTHKTLYMCRTCSAETLIPMLCGTVQSTILHFMAAIIFNASIVRHFSRDDAPKSSHSTDRAMYGSVWIELFVHYSWILIFIFIFFNFRSSERLNGPRERERWMDIWQIWAKIIFHWIEIGTAYNDDRTQNLLLSKHSACVPFYSKVEVGKLRCSPRNMSNHNNA